jgi:hypothetical protein
VEYQQVPIRVERGKLDVLKVIAAWFGRSLNSELVNAAEAWTHMAMLAILHDPAAKDDPELRKRLEEIPDYEAQVRLKLETLCSAAFDRSLPPELFENFGVAA